MKADKFKRGKKESVSLVLDLDMIREIDKLAKEEDRNRSSMVRKILLDYFKRRG